MNTRTDRIVTSLTRTQAAEIRRCLDAAEKGRIKEWAAQHCPNGREAPYPATVGVMIFWLEGILRDAERFDV